MSGLRAWLSVCAEWTLAGLGAGCLAVFAYQSVEARRFQAEHAAEFARAAEAGAAPAIRAGGLVGMLDVPRLKLTTAVIEGDDEATLQYAAGHLPDTPLPWQAGNSAIAAHRDGLFRPLKDIKVGDEIRFRGARHERRYRVTSTTIVDPEDVEVLKPGAKDAVTLITCYPFRYVGTAPRRFVVRAEAY